MAGIQHSPFGSGTDSNFANSPPPHPQGSAQQQAAATHQRTYQACIPCRNRKVRCDLGSVDSPHDPPCSRCRRESKECFFSSTRRKRKNDTNEVAEAEEEELVVKAARKRVRTQPPEPVHDDSIERPRTPGGSLGRTQPLRRPAPTKQPQYDEEDLKASDQTTAMLQGAEVHGGHDALKVLVDAANRLHGRTGSMNSNAKPTMQGLSSVGLPSATSPILNTGTVREQSWKGKLNMLSLSDTTTEKVSPDTPGYAAAIKAWTRFRFVRSGWFTAKEGIAYVVYFYKYLSPLTPVTLPDFSNLNLHEKLLTQERMLIVTVLLVASRHMQLEGPGSESRPHTIHHKLWRYLQGMVDRVTWGQEQFGGGLCGAGSQPGCDVNPLTRKGLRTLGTVESLMLLTEWHPRAMHFPPDEADDELMAPEITATTADTELNDDSAKGIGGQRMDSWLEPCWRSDRMCWMLLGMAMSLAFEIGVFDKSEWQRHAFNDNGQPMSADEMQHYDKRRSNVRDLLLVYVTLTSGRLGLTSMLPGNYSKPEDSELYQTLPNEHNSIQETVLQFWLRIAAIMREGNRKIFANKSFTRDLIKNGSYKLILEQFRQPLLKWRCDFDDCAFIPKYMRYILSIEHCYCRVYLNALSLQAVAERCANEFPQVNNPPMDLSQSTITSSGIRADVAINPQTLHKWLGDDRIYMNEVRDAACSLLTIVVDGLYPGGYLRHAPVRTYFRIISVAIMLCKSFSLGASGNDVSDSFMLMDKTVAALRTCIVDDVHVASRFADLLDVLIQNLKPRLVRINADGRVTRSTKQSVQTTPVSGQDVAPSNSATGRYGPQQYFNHNASSLQPTPAWPFGGMANNAPDDGYDAMANQEFSVMPPPSFGLQPSAMPTASMHTTASYAAPAYANDNSTGYGNGYIDPANYDANGTQDWFALPLDPLLTLSGADVNNGPYGPEVAGQDMLELLLNGNNSY